MTREQIGQIIKEARTKAGYSYYRLQKMSGLTVQQLMSIEKGDKNYTVDSLIAIDQALEIEIFNQKP